MNFETNCKNDSIRRGRTGVCLDLNYFIKLFVLISIYLQLEEVILQLVQLGEVKFSE